MHSTLWVSLYYFITLRWKIKLKSHHALCTHDERDEACSNNAGNTQQVQASLRDVKIMVLLIANASNGFLNKENVMYEPVFRCMLKEEIHYL